MEKSQFALPPVHYFEPTYSRGSGPSKLRLPGMTTNKPASFSQAVDVTGLFESRDGLWRWQQRVLVHTLADDPSMLKSLVSCDLAEDTGPVDDLITKILRHPSNNYAYERAIAAYKWAAAIDNGDADVSQAPEVLQPALRAYLAGLSEAGLTVVPGWVNRYIYDGSTKTVGRLDRLYATATGDYVVGRITVKGDTESSLMSCAANLALCGLGTKVLSADGTLWEDRPEALEIVDHGVITYLPYDGEVTAPLHMDYGTMTDLYTLARDAYGIARGAEKVLAQAEFKRTRRKSQVSASRNDIRPLVVAVEELAGLQGAPDDPVPAPAPNLITTLRENKTSIPVPAGTPLAPVDGMVPGVIGGAVVADPVTGEVAMTPPPVAAPAQAPVAMTPPPVAAPIQQPVAMTPPPVAPPTQAPVAMTPPPGVPTQTPVAMTPPPVAAPSVTPVTPPWHTPAPLTEADVFAKIATATSRAAVEAVYAEYGSLFTPSLTAAATAQWNALTN